MIYLRAFIGHSWQYLGTDANHEPILYYTKEMANPLSTMHAAEVLKVIVNKLPKFAQTPLEIHQE